MGPTVIVLGAGASASCGAPVMAQFLDFAETVKKSRTLDTKAQAHFDLVFSALEELNRAHTKASLDTDNVEDVFAALEMAELLNLELFPGDLGAAMRTVIARTIEAHVEFPVDGTMAVAPADYAALVDWIERRMGEELPPTIITFNYDCALDYALWRHIQVDYGFETSDDDSTRVSLLKLHGSLNWIRQGDTIIPYYLEGLKERIQVHFGREVRSGQSTLRLPISQITLQNHFKKEQKEGELAIVPPVWSKLEHYRSMRAVWARAAEALRGAENIVVCGYSFPQTDQFFRHLFALGTIGPSRIKAFHVLDPNNKVVGPRFESLLGPQTRGRFKTNPAHFEYLPTWLEQWVV